MPTCRAHTCDRTEHTHTQSTHTLHTCRAHVITQSTHMHARTQSTCAHVHTHTRIPLEHPLCGSWQGVDGTHRTSSRLCLVLCGKDRPACPTWPCTAPFGCWAETATWPTSCVSQSRAPRMAGTPRSWRRQGRVPPQKPSERPGPADAQVLNCRLQCCGRSSVRGLLTPH